MAATPADTLVPTTFNTSHLGAADQFDAWREFVGDTTDVTPVGSLADGFAARIDVWDAGSMAFVSSTLPGQGHARRYQMRRRNPVDHWCLMLTGTDSNETPSLPPKRQLKLRQLARPFDHVSDDSRMLIFYICRDLFPQISTTLDAIPTDVPRSVMAGIVADYMVSASRLMPHLTKAELPAFAEATRALLAAWATLRADDIQAAEQPINLTLNQRATNYVRQNLRSPLLAPETVGRAIGASRSKLYRLFEGRGGVARYIQRQRLLAALAQLSDPGNEAPIADVAASFTFADPSSFSRAFRQEFGFSPSEAREAIRIGAPIPRSVDGTVKQGSFGGVLRRLQV